jgi:hypothetical protein
MFQFNLTLLPSNSACFASLYLSHQLLSLHFSLLCFASLYLSHPLFPIPPSFSSLCLHLSILLVPCPYPSIFLIPVCCISLSLSSLVPYSSNFLIPVFCISLSFHLSHSCVLHVSNPLIPNSLFPDLSHSCVCISLSLSSLVPCSSIFLILCCASLYNSVPYSPSLHLSHSCFLHLSIPLIPCS